MLFISVSDWQCARVRRRNGVYASWLVIGSVELEKLLYRLGDGRSQCPLKPRYFLPSIQTTDRQEQLQLPSVNQLTASCAFQLDGPSITRIYGSESTAKRVEGDWEDPVKTQFVRVIYLPPRILKVAWSISHKKSYLRLWKSRDASK